MALPRPLANFSSTLTALATLGAPQAASDRAQYEPDYGGASPAGRIGGEFEDPNCYYGREDPIPRRVGRLRLP